MRGWGAGWLFLESLLRSACEAARQRQTLMFLLGQSRDLQQLSLKPASLFCPVLLCVLAVVLQAARAAPLVVARTCSAAPTGRVC